MILCSLFTNLRVNKIIDRILCVVYYNTSSVVRPIHSVTLTEVKKKKTNQRIVLLNSLKPRGSIERYIIHFARSESTMIKNTYAIQSFKYIYVYV